MTYKDSTYKSDSVNEESRDDKPVPDSMYKEAYENSCSQPGSNNFRHARQESPELVQSGKLPDLTIGESATVAEDVQPGSNKKSESEGQVLKTKEAADEPQKSTDELSGATAFEKLLNMVTARLGEEREVKTENGCRLRRLKDGKFEATLPDFTTLIIDPKLKTATNEKGVKYPLSTNDKGEIVIEKDGSSKLTIAKDGSVQEISESDGDIYQTDYPAHGKWLKRTNTVLGIKSEEYDRLNPKDGEPIKLDDGSEVTFRGNTIIIKEGEKSWSFTKSGDRVELKTAGKDGKYVPLDFADAEKGLALTRSDNVFNFADGTTVNVNKPGSRTCSISRPGANGSKIQARFREEGGGRASITVYHAEKK